MAKRKSTTGRRAGLFIGGVMFGLVRGIFFKNKYWGVVMSFLKVNQIDKVWANICKYEGDVFYTKNHLQYTYIVKDNYVIINIPSKTKITKNYFEKALEVNNPTPTKINLRGQSYIYGTITDSRIVK